MIHAPTIVNSKILYNFPRQSPSRVGSKVLGAMVLLTEFTEFFFHGSTIK